ncbi:hypothetical protein CISIN_1g046751mg [Citrus sinensis]|uniref:Uncharacterized protein n=1 Tax=Citrus sinensis TaxID=2711 RepID=A0A067EGM0_CITSI|nr:hypothetical protein CISIN_1g046751mg [Citrus sinensis]
MILKLNKLKLPLKWENVAKIAGKGVAPGRLHVARAMVEAGHVENLKHAFADISMMGDMHTPQVVVELIHRTSGLAVLAHPWALKNPAAIIRKLKDVGLHRLEVYRSDGKLVGVIFTLQDGSHYESKKEIESIVLEILCSIIYLMRESEFESQFLL